ncbi:hypothetical protein V8D89_003155 [Ganoderma adspersum]
MALPSMHTSSLIVLLILSIIGPTLGGLEMGSIDPIPECAEDELSDTVLHWVASVAAGTDMIFELSDSPFHNAADCRHLSLLPWHLNFQSATSNFGDPTPPSGVRLHYQGEQGYHILFIIHWWIAFADAHREHRAREYREHRESRAHREYRGHRKRHREHREYTQPNRPGRIHISITAHINFGYAAFGASGSKLPTQKL